MSDFYESREWRAARWKRIKMDRLRCVRCRKHGHWGRGLSVHHIIPRRQGGGEYMGNLVTLCRACHDLIENEGLRSVAAIIGFSQGEHGEPGDESSVDDSVAITWQEVVYGGARTTIPQLLVCQEPQGIEWHKVIWEPSIEEVTKLIMSMWNRRL